MSRPAESPPPDPGWAWLAGAWAVALGIMVLAAWSVEATWIRPSLQAPQGEAAGRTQWGGLIPEFRSPPRIFLDNDPYYWIRYAEEVARGERWRIRSTQLDNVPYGREVHWNSGWMWYLAGLGALWGGWKGQPAAAVVAEASLVAGPLLLAGVLIGTGIWLARRMGGRMAAGFVLTFTLLPAILWDYGYARPDHHGFHNTAALLLMLGWVLAGGGWVAQSLRGKISAEGWRRARWGVHVAAAGAALGLWVGATQQIFVLAGVGLGLVAGMVTGRPGERERLEPGLFRRWGTEAAGLSALFYLLEYAPNHFAMRLEVNHPLYICALWAGGEFLATVAERCTGGPWPRGWAAARLLLAGALLVLPPLALGLGPAEWHAWKDEAMRRQHDFINEFEPFTNSVRNAGLQTILARFGLLPLLIPVAGVLMLKGGGTGARRSAVAVAGAAATITGIMMVLQVRWAGLFSTSLAVLALAVAAAVWEQWRRPEEVGWGPRWLPWAWLAALLPLGIFFGLGMRDNLVRVQARILDPVLAWTIASRDLAFNLKRVAKAAPVRVMSGPGQTPALHFFGGVHGTAALYWENTQGVREAAEFFADQGEEEAKRIARERGITHVVLQQDTTLAESSVRIALDSDDPELIKQSLAYRLCDPLGTTPAWLEPMPYYGSPMAANFQMRVFRVRPEKLSPAQ